MARASSIDERYMGNEPTISRTSSRSDIIRAYNWYNYFHDVDAAKGFVISYIKSKKVNKSVLARLDQIEPIQLRSIGWNCRILMNGGTLPDDIKQQFVDKLQSLVDTVKPKKAKVIDEEHITLSIQDRIQNRVNDLIGDLEEQIDIFIVNGKNDDFKASAWFRDNMVKAPIAKKIVEYYKPLYDQVFDAIQGKNDDLDEYYRNWKKTKLKKYLEFIKNIISAASVNIEATKITRKPRKKKVKPAAVLVSKLKYQQEDKEYGIKSVEPKDIVGSQQVWLFNTKYRTLTMLNALSATGFTVKGTTILGMDDKNSQAKTLRKPETTLPTILSASKPALRKLLNTIKGKEKSGKGRINSDTIILRTIK
jgi:hypothetical protein